MDRAADSDPSSIPLGEKKENKQKRGLGWPILKKLVTTGMRVIRQVLGGHCKAMESKKSDFSL